jgi:hypothetical protein
MSRKPPQIGTFASHLRHFARSVDIVDWGTLSDVQQLIFDYLQEEFDAKYLELSIQHEVNGVPGLRTFRSSSNRSFSVQIEDANGEYTCQAALCYAERKSLWIVGVDQKPLRIAQGYWDMWSEVTALPKYRPPLDQQALFTSVLIPVCRPNDRILGVMVIESSKYQDKSQFDEQEFLDLADAWGVLYDLREFNEIQTRGTRDAVEHLRKLKDLAGFPQMSKAQVFLSYADKADNRVIGLVIEEIGKLRDSPTIVKWRDIEASGQITTQIDDAINASRFGVCYLSEPGGQDGFQDNANVLIEAGMFHEREVSQGGTICLLIRERNSPPSPFDIANQRILYVPRENGVLNPELFKAELEGRLAWLMQNAR